MELELIEREWSDTDWRRWAIQEATSVCTEPGNVIWLATEIMAFVFPEPDKTAQFRTA